MRNPADTQWSMQLLLRCVPVLAGITAVLPMAVQAQVDEAPAAAVEEPLTTIPVAVESEDTTPVDIAQGNTPQIEEVIVTSTKRAKALREIPASIASVSGEALEQQGAQGVEDIVKQIPGVNINSPGDSAARITIRGISAGAGSAPTTGVLFGDVSFSDLYVPLVTLDPNPFDLQNVEVLKGPQGTLYGAGALNGAIRYVPMPPAFGTTEFKYFAQYTKVEQGDGAPIYGAAVNLPFGADDQWALRLVGFDRRSPGYVDNLQLGRQDVNRIDQQGVRGILGWRPGEAWDIALTYARQVSDGADSSIADNTDGKLSTTNRPRTSPSHNDYSLTDLAIRYDLDWAKLVSDSAYISKNVDNFSDASSRLPGNGQLPLYAQSNVGRSETWSQELRLVSADDPDDRWQWVVGAYAARQESQTNISIDVGDASLPLQTVVDLLNALLPGAGGLVSGEGNVRLAEIATDITIDELAAFGDVTRKLGKSFELSLGGRFYQTTSGGTNRQQGALLAIINGELENVAKGEITEKGFNPKASLVWHATPQILAYANTSRGFRTGGLQPGFTSPFSPTAAPAVFKSDSLWNYETGLRTQWLDNTLHLDVAAFYTEWKDPQFLQVESGLLPLSSYVDNVGGVKSRGVDLALRYLFPWQGLSLSASAAYADTVTTKPFTTSDGSVAPPGSRWPFAPSWQTATTLAYLYALETWVLGASVTHSFIGTASNDLAQDLDMFGYQQWDLQFSVANPALAWFPEITLTANNLLDERGKLFIYEGPSYVDVNYIRPRALTLRLSGRF